MRRWIVVLVLLACAACGTRDSKPASRPAPAATPASRMPPEMDVTYGRLFAKDGLSKVSAYTIEINCFAPVRPEDTHAMTDGQEHSPEMSLTRDPSPKGFDAFVAWLEKIEKKPGSQVVYARAFDGAKHVGWAALCITPPPVLLPSDFSTENVPERTVRLTPSAIEKLRKVPNDVNIAFMLDGTAVLTTAPVSALLAAEKNPTITFKQPGT